MKHPVTIDYYEERFHRPNQNPIVVHVCGYSLHPDESTSIIAIKIAKQLGASSIPVTSYGAGAPTKSAIKVHYA